MRVFVAVWPPVEVARAVAALERPTVAGLRWTSPELWHATLRFCGRMPGAGVADLVAALTTGLAGEGPVAARLGSATDRFCGRVLHVPVTGLDPLAGRVREVTASFGEFPVDDLAPFHGHLTLARARRGIPASLVGVPVATAAWPVAEVAVVASTTTAGGPRYETVATVSLGGAISR